MKPSELKTYLSKLLGKSQLAGAVALDEVTCEIAAADIKNVCAKLRDDKNLRFDTLIDLCGVDYASWGEEDGSQGGTGSPGGPAVVVEGKPKARFAVVYHLLSVQKNLRLRLRTFLDEAALEIDSVTEIFPAANWYEREAFDLFGILFLDHPDLRRLLTDYGFIGHPMRKDFPLSGQVEMRYDEELRRVIYQPVTIEPRTLVPRTLNKPVENV